MLWCLRYYLQKIAINESIYYEGEFLLPVGYRLLTFKLWAQFSLWQFKITLFFPFVQWYLAHITSSHSLSPQPYFYLISKCLHVLWHLQTWALWPWSMPKAVVHALHEYINLDKVSFTGTSLYSAVTSLVCVLSKLPAVSCWEQMSCSKCRSKGSQVAQTAVLPLPKYPLGQADFSWVSTKMYYENWEYSL